MLSVSRNGRGEWYTAPDYRVIDTDYTSYAIIYSCNQFGPIVNNLSWLLTRVPFNYEEESGGFYTMIDKVDPIYAEKIPNYDRAGRMRNTWQASPGCNWSGLPWDY